MSANMRRLLRRALLPLALAGATAASACPDGLPKELKGEGVGEETVVNGLPVTIVQVTGKASAADVLGSVEADWARQKYDVKRQRIGLWDVVSARSERCNTTLQLIDRSGSFGYFAIGRPAQVTAWLPKRLGVTLPGNITLNSTVSSADSGRKATTIAFSTKRAVADLNDYFLAHLSQAGWDAVGSHELRMGEDHHARIVSAQRGREQIEVVLWEDGLTRAVLNLADAL